MSTNEATIIIVSLLLNTRRNFRQTSCHLRNEPEWNQIVGKSLFRQEKIDKSCNETTRTQCPSRGRTPNIMNSMGLHPVTTNLGHRWYFGAPRIQPRRRRPNSPRSHRPVSRKIHQDRGRRHPTGPRRLVPDTHLHRSIGTHQGERSMPHHTEWIPMDMEHEASPTRMVP